MPSSSGSSAAEAPKKTRASASKVRTGCVTCKIRHVKCDEGKPFCRRCTSTGRKCDGYEQPRPVKTPMRNVMTVYVAPVQAQRMLAPLPGWDELDRYHRFVAPKLSGYFNSPFWSTLIPQLAHSEPAVRHAVIAISAVHQDMESLNLPSHTANIEPNAVVLKETSEAMRSLSMRMSSDPSSSLVPLVACLLFTCLEFLKGNTETAMVHMTNGFKILLSIKTNVNESDVQQMRDSKSINEHIVPVFARLNLLCLLFGRALPFKALEDWTMDLTTFTSLEDARLHLYDVINTVIRFIRTSTRRADTGEIDITDVIEKIKLERRMQHWLTCFQRYLEDTTAAGRPVEISAVNILKLHFRTIFVWLSVSLCIEETACDLHYADFDEIITLGEIIVSTPPPTGPSGLSNEPRRFSFEMGVIPSLYFATIKCRDPVLRRRSLAVLRSAPMREGLWNGHISASVAQRLIQVEESGKRSCDLIPPGLSAPMWSRSANEQDNEEWRLQSVSTLDLQLGQGLRPPEDVVVPPEEERVHSVTDPPMEFQSVHKIVMSNHSFTKWWQCTTKEGSNDNMEESKGRVLVTFRSKPWGLNGDWHIWKDYVNL